jgi:chromosome partitioning protein
LTNEIHKERTLKTIALGLQKGGVGKTSLALALAGQIAQDYGATIILDADPQGNASGQLCPEVNIELADLLFDFTESKKLDLAPAVTQTSFHNLSIISTAGLGGRLRLYAETQAARWPWAIDELCKSLAEWGFRYCIIDTSPAFGPLETAAFLASDEVLTPVMGDVYGQDGLTIFMDNLNRAKRANRSDKPAYSRIIFNALDKRIPSHEHILTELKTAAPNMNIYTIPTDPIFRKAQDASAVIQATKGAKADTMNELKRLAKDLY